jgi:hypothetical protein
LIDILDTTELAHSLGVTVNTIHGLSRERGQVIPHFKIGRELKFRKDSVLLWLAKEEEGVRQ